MRLTENTDIAESIRDNTSVEMEFDRIERSAFSKANFTLRTCFFGNKSAETVRSVYDNGGRAKGIILFVNKDRDGFKPSKLDSLDCMIFTVDSMESNCNEILMRVSSKMYLNDTVAKADAKLISDTRFNICVCGLNCDYVSINMYEIYETDR